MSVLRLEVEFLGYWHAGTGRGSGHHLDALTCRDACGLPYLPGKTLRGLLRDAVAKLEKWGVEPAIGGGTTQQLFGGPAWERDGDTLRTRERTEPGALFVSDARLPEPVRRFLGWPGEEQARLRAGLFRAHFSTAITQAGVAREKSLRGMELVVPLVLEAEVKPLPGREVEGWREAILAALPLVRAAGAHRTRGLGRCVIREAGRG